MTEPFCHHAFHHHQYQHDTGYESPTESDHPPCLTCPSDHPLPSLACRAVNSSFCPSVRTVGFNRPFDSARPPRSSDRLSTHSVLTAVEYSSHVQSLDVVVERKLPLQNVRVLDRICCHQWTWFTMTMATGGMANVLHSIPYRSNWLFAIGAFVMLLNIVLFLTNCICISIRFCVRPGSFTQSFTDQFESLFIPSFFVSLGTICINICQYGIPHAGTWLQPTMEYTFCVYVAVSIIASAGMYLVLWSTLVFPVHTMTPVWVFPAYPLLLTAPFAANYLSATFATGHTPSLDATALALCALTTQGTGCLIAMLISAAFLYRLMTQKLPRDVQRPGMFVSIGPFGFTVAGIIQLGSLADKIIPTDMAGAADAALIVRILSVMNGLWLWGLSMWFFFVSVGSLWKYVRPESGFPFQMNWWSFVFPNTALVTATLALGKALNSRGMQMFGCVLAAMLAVVWVMVFGFMLKSLRKRTILWPELQSKERPDNPA